MSIDQSTTFNTDDEDQPMDKWQVTIRDTDELAYVSNIVHLLQNDIKNDQLPVILDNYLKFINLDPKNRELIIKYLLTNEKYRNDTIKELLECVESYTMTLDKLPLEIICNIISRLDIESLRSIYNVNSKLRIVMDSKVFIQTLYEMHNIPFKIRQTKSKNKKLFTYWSERYIKYKYDPHICEQTMNPIQITRCFNHGLKQHLYNEVYILINRSILSEINLNWGYVWRKLLINYVSEFDQLMPALFRFILYHEPITLSQSKVDLTRLSWPIVESMLHSLSDEDKNNKNIIYAFVFANRYLISTDQIDLWLQFSVENYIFLSNYDYRRMIYVTNKTSAKYAVKYNQPKVLSAIIKNNTYAKLNRFYMEMVGGLQDNTLLKQLVLDLQDIDPNILFGCLRYAINYKVMTNIILICDNIKPQLWSHYLSMPLNDQNILYMSILGLTKQTTIINEVLQILTNNYILNDNRIQFNKMLQHILINTPSLFIEKYDVIASAFYSNLLPVVGEIPNVYIPRIMLPKYMRFDIPLAIENVINLLFDVNSKITKDEVWNYIDWLISRPGFTDLRVNINYVTKNDIIKPLLKYMSRYTYIYDDFKQVHLRVPIYRQPEDEKNHQLILMHIFSIRIYDPIEKVDLELLENIIRKITNREELKTLYESIEGIPSDVNQLIQSMLYPKLRRHLTELYKNESKGEFGSEAEFGEFGPETDFGEFGSEAEFGLEAEFELEDSFDQRSMTNSSGGSMANSSRGSMANSSRASIANSSRASIANSSRASMANNDVDDSSLAASSS